MIKPLHLRLAAVFVPVLVIAGWIATYAFDLTTGSPVRLKVVGFDPRDLLSGHYLMYRVDYGTEVDCSSRAKAWCLCLETDNSEHAVVASQGECPAAASCRHVLRGNCANGRFEAGLERYYFSEDYRRELAVVPPDASIVVSLSRSGEALVKEMLVGDEPILEWVKSRSHF